MVWLIALLVLVALVVIALVVLYNRFVRLRNRVDNSWAQIEVALKSAQRVIIYHSFVSQADDGFSFDAQRLVLQTLILWCGDFATAIIRY